MLVGFVPALTNTLEQAYVGFGYGAHFFLFLVKSMTIKFDIILCRRLWRSRGSMLFVRANNGAGGHLTVTITLFRRMKLGVTSYLWSTNFIYNHLGDQASQPIQGFIYP